MLEAITINLAIFETRENKGFRVYSTCILSFGCMPYKAL